MKTSKLTKPIVAAITMAVLGGSALGQEEHKVLEQ